MNETNYSTSGIMMEHIIYMRQKVDNIEYVYHTIDLRYVPEPPMQPQDPLHQIYLSITQLSLKFRTIL